MQQEVWAWGFLPLGWTEPGDAWPVDGATGQMCARPFSKMCALGLKSLPHHPCGHGTCRALGWCLQPRPSLGVVGLEGPPCHPGLPLVVRCCTLASLAFESITYIIFFLLFCCCLLFSWYNTGESGLGCPVLEWSLQAGDVAQPLTCWQQETRDSGDMHGVS